MILFSIVCFSSCFSIIRESSEQGLILSIMSYTREQMDDEPRTLNPVETGQIESTLTGQDTRQRLHCVSFCSLVVDCFTSKYLQVQTLRSSHMPWATSRNYALMTCGGLCQGLTTRYYKTTDCKGSWVRTCIDGMLDLLESNPNCGLFSQEHKDNGHYSSAPQISIIDGTPVTNRKVLLVPASQLQLFSEHSNSSSILVCSFFFIILIFLVITISLHPRV